MTVIYLNQANRFFKFVGLTLLGILAFSFSSKADPYEYTWTELATDVWTGIREKSTRWPAMGSTTFVVLDDSVIVYDGGGTPLMSERTIEKIKSVTDKPVSHVIISHWHGDHNFGIYKFREEYPDVKFIGHPYTRAAMLGATMDYVKSYPDLIPTFLPKVEGYLETGTFSSGTPLTEGDRELYEQLIADANIVHEEFNRVRITPPDTLVEEKMVFESKNSRVELLFLGNGNTKGDLVLWLPKEQIVAVGDLVVLPIPYGSGSYPREWAETLRAVKELGFKTLIPGHGKIQFDNTYIDRLTETLDLVANQMAGFVSQGLSQKNAQAALDFSTVEKCFTKGDEFFASRFRVWFKIPIGEAAYLVETGQLTEILEHEQKNSHE